MSYCRWSSNFGECDVYVYENISGCWTTHVAGRRLKHKMPDAIKQMPRKTPDDLMAAWAAEKKWRESLPSNEIACTKLDGSGKKVKGSLVVTKDSEFLALSEVSPYAGMTFNDPTPGACARTLEKIRGSGLNIPQYVIDTLNAEQEALGDE